MIDMIPGGATQLLKPSTRDRFLDCELGPERKLSLEVGSSPQKKRFQRIFSGWNRKNCLPTSTWNVANGQTHEKRTSLYHLILANWDCTFWKNHGVVLHTSPSAWKPSQTDFWMSLARGTQCKVHPDTFNCFPASGILNVLFPGEYPGQCNHRTGPESLQVSFAKKLTQGREWTTWRIGHAVYICLYNWI